MVKLTVEERDRIMATLAQEQREYLQEELTRGRRTVFANILARQKGHFIPGEATFEDIEHLLDSWIYIGYIDAGHVSPELKCECGRSLRYQHTVENKKTGEVLKFGIDHLELHTGIDAKTVNEIVSGFGKYDFELDEILLKVTQNWTIEQEHLPDFSHLVLPSDVQRHIQLGLPLLGRQIQRIRKLINESFFVSTRKQPQLPSTVSHKRNDPLNLSFQFDGKEQHSMLSSLELPVEYQTAVLEYLHKGIQRAQIICELLIENHGAPSGRFSTNKPKIYPNVCYFIDGLGRAELVEATKEDRAYRWVKTSIST